MFWMIDDKWALNPAILCSDNLQFSVNHQQFLYADNFSNIQFQ